MKNQYFIEGDVVYIMLHQNMYTTIDLEDLKKVDSCEGFWTTCKNSSGEFYYVQQNTPKYVSLHRFIMETPKGLLVDHINHNTLDNRKSNLRNVTPGQNQQNIRKFKGYYYHKKSKRYIVKFRVNKKDVYGGSFKTKDEAYKKVLEMRAELLPFSQEALKMKDRPDAPTSDH